MCATCGQNGCGCESVEIPYIRGTPGDSAYQIWLNIGNIGSANDFIASLLGADGEDGQSAYDLAVENGYGGTASEWLTSLIGAAGTNGVDGGDPINAYSYLSGTFTVPTIDGPPNTVTIDPGNPSTWVGIDQPVYLEGAGMFRVYNSSPTSVDLMNPGPGSWSELEATGYPGNAAPGTIITIGSKLSPGGRAGRRGISGLPGTSTPGPAGTPGTNGTNGTNVLWINHSPVGEPPSYGKVGDIAIDTGTDNQVSFWSKTLGDTWIFMGKLTGYAPSAVPVQTFNVGRTDSQPIPIGSTAPMIVQFNKYTGDGNFNGGLWNGAGYIPLTSPATPQTFRLEHFCIKGLIGENVDFDVDITVDGISVANVVVSVTIGDPNSGIATLATSPIVMTSTSVVRVVVTPQSGTTKQFSVDNVDLVFYNQI